MELPGELEVICPRCGSAYVYLSRLRSLVSSFLKGSERLSRVPKECVSIYRDMHLLCIRGNRRRVVKTRYDAVVKTIAASETRDETSKPCLKEGKQRTVSSSIGTARKPFAFWLDHDCNSTTRNSVRDSDQFVITPSFL